MQIHMGKHPYYIFRKQGNLPHSKDILHNPFYFPNNAIRFIILSSPLCSNNMCFISHVLKFKYSPQQDEG